MRPCYLHVLLVSHQEHHFYIHCSCTMWYKYWKRKTKVPLVFGDWVGVGDNPQKKRGQETREVAAQIGMKMWYLYLCGNKNRRKRNKFTKVQRKQEESNGKNKVPPPPHPTWQLYLYDPCKTSTWTILQVIPDINQSALILFQQL